MSNHAVMMMHARRGMGGLGELSGWFDEWGQSIIGQGFDFGKTFIQAKYAKDAAKFQAPNPYTAVQPTVPPGYPPNYPNPNSGDEYGSGGISSAGIRIGGTLVTWPVIGLGVGMLFLLQSPGFSRKR